MIKLIPELTVKQQARFWAGVDTDCPNGCWEWRGKRDKNGYGIFFANNHYRAHRVSMALAGSDPLGLCVCHRCDNPCCVNPAHLFIGTHADNSADRVAKGRAASGLRNGAYTKPDRLRKGEDNGRAKVSASDVVAIRSDTRPTALVAAQYGIDRSSVNRIKRQISWTCV